MKPDTILQFDVGGTLFKARWSLFGNSPAVAALFPKPKKSLCVFLDWDADSFARVLSLLRYRSLAAVPANALAPDETWRLVRDLERLGLWADGAPAEGIDAETAATLEPLVALLTDHPLATAETAANAADASDSAPKTKYGCGRVGLGSELLFDKTVDVERAVKYNIHCGTAAFKLSEVITNDDGDVDVVPRLITLNRIKAKLQEPNGRALRKAPYTHDAIHVKIDPTVHAPTQFSLTLRDQHFTIECPTHAEALIAALSIRRFKEKFMVVTRLET
ncbi:uncharacterized protein AMSG_01563 [Thecamonas trahens ATCC 50062]|uniref:Uncharacterized protein n=1 Tax=Thecamonas trahens ATCC 50062 TaxID=461836 RepID=A0A0L0DTD5_THETB|nr:hypothetical protein AMSG_01563 [Thecamonas trahens ATCC 50062]KNC54713.1 hypothetical protein AMSG_01563 [Thecamonas trahens ATCC 50062]|eukprot:XP_013761613.1 hypothetical protein AMSG_01563 [Thecamonas trahens ATCC 50062]